MSSKKLEQKEIEEIKNGQSSMKNTITEIKKKIHYRKPIAE